MCYTPKFVLFFVGLLCMEHLKLSTNVIFSLKNIYELLRLNYLVSINL